MTLCLAKTHCVSGHQEEWSVRASTSHSTDLRPDEAGLCRQVSVLGMGLRCVCICYELFPHSQKLGLNKGTISETSMNIQLLQIKHLDEENVESTMPFYKERSTEPKHRGGQT